MVENEKTSSYEKKEQKVGLEMEVGHKRWQENENQIQVVEKNFYKKMEMEMENC